MKNDIPTTQNISINISKNQEEFLDKFLDKVILRYFPNKEIDVDIVCGVPISPACMHIQTTQGSPVPPAGFIPELNLILIHPYLIKKRDRWVPNYVFTYLIYHECLHYLYPAEDGKDPHHSALMEQEKKAPQRNSAIAWLKNNNFPTLK